MRLDKWLWAARFFKTRSLAQQAVAGGRVQLNGDRTKPAHEVKANDMVVVRVGDWRWEVKVRRSPSGAGLRRGRGSSTRRQGRAVRRPGGAGTGAARARSRRGRR